MNDEVVLAMGAWAKNAGHGVVEQLVVELQALAPRNPLEAALLAALNEALAKEDLVGVLGLVLDDLEDTLDEVPASELRGYLTLKQRSDLLAALQIAEADEKQAALEKLEAVGEILGRVLKAALAVVL